jgi:hypothetical protein
MKYGGYYVLFFIFIGSLSILLYYYNIQQQQQQQYNNQQLINANQSGNPAIKYNSYNTDDDHIKLYKDEANYKKTNSLNNIDNYTYNIENIDILKDNTNNLTNDSSLGNKNPSTYEKELEEVYNSTLRGNINYTNETDEIFTYSVKPNKTDLPIVNPPLQLLQSNTPLRLSERHILYN